MSINKMNIIIPKKDWNSPVRINKEELLKNLKEITPEQLNQIDEEMKVAREKREKETEDINRKKYSKELYSFKSDIDKKKPKNLLWFSFEDSKVTENWEKVWIVLLYDYNRDYHDSFSDLEFWKKIFIKVWDYQTSKELVYRDAKDAKKDDWSKAYTKIARLEIQWDILKVWLSKKDWAPTLYEIEIPKQKNEEERYLDLSNTSQDLFNNYVLEETERLIEKETRDHKYPNIFWYWARSIPNLRVCEIPYDKAEVADAYQDLQKWICYIVIKTQIDADSTRGKQYSRIKYKIEVDQKKFNPIYMYDINKEYIKTTLIEKESAREDELVNWRKINLKAYDF